MSRGKRNLHDENLHLRCPGCAKTFATAESVKNHVRATLHGEWIIDFSVKDEGDI